MENRTMNLLEDIDSVLDIYQEEIKDLKQQTRLIADQFLSKSKNYWSKNLPEFSELVDELLEIQNARKSLDDYKQDAILSLNHE
jgi:hypothetical protein